MIEWLTMWRDIGQRYASDWIGAKLAERLKPFKGTVLTDEAKAEIEHLIAGEWCIAPVMYVIEVAP